MPELRIATPPPAPARRLALREALSSLVSGWQPLAEDVLGADSRIDWVGRDAEGRAVIVLLAGAQDALTLVAQGLAQRDWVAARVADWAQLTPSAGLRPEAGVRVVLLAPDFSPAARAAARAGASAPGGPLCLARLRFVENGSGVGPLLEPLEGSEPAEPEAGGAGAGSFRTGLAPEDLDLSPEELAEFDGPDRLD